MIQNAATVLKTVWDRNCIYRIGGDEFAIVCSDVEKEKIERDKRREERRARKTAE